MRSRSFRGRFAILALAILPALISAGPTAALAAADDVCSSGPRTLSSFGARVYPDQGNGGYTSVHTDLHINYDTQANLFLPGTRADLTIASTQCLTDFSFDFERTAMSGSAAGPNMTVSSVEINGQPATFDFRQPTYPGNPNGPDDPDPLAHAISNVNPVNAANPNPPACSPQTSGNSQNGLQCPFNKLVITPDSPIPSGTSLTVTVNYSGRPGVHVDGDGSTEGWFRVNTAAAPNDGSFVTTEPIGNMAWMPLNNHPSAKPSYDVYDTVPVGKTAIAPGVLVGYTPSAAELPAQPTTVNPPDANFPGGSWTWQWHAPEPIASYLVTNTIGSYDLSIRTSTRTGIQYYIGMASGLTAARKTTIKAVLDQQESITDFHERFSGPFPFTANGVIVALPSVGFAEEMQTKITFGNGASSTPSLGTFHHEVVHQWWGDNVAESAFNMTFWKEGWATVGEYLNTARTAANGPGGLGTVAGNAAFETSLINRFNTNYGSTSGSAWTSAPSNPTVGNLFTTVSTYTRPGTAYLALRQILDSAYSRPESDRWLGAMLQIQAQYGGGSITQPQLQDVFHQWLPNQSAACHAKLDQFFSQWFDTAYPTPNNATNKPQITGPGLNGPDKFYDDAGACTRADQAITFGALSDRTFLEPDFGVSATSDSGLPVAFSATGQCTVAGATVRLTGAGSCTITANQAGDGVFLPAAPVEQTFAIARAGQAITFAALPDRTYGDADFDLAATASSGLAVSYAAAGSCAVAGATVSITAIGGCAITASQGGNVDYLPAADAAQGFSIGQAGTVTTTAIVRTGSNPVAQYSDTAGVRASVSPVITATGDGVFSGTVAFTFDGVAIGSAPVSNLAPTAEVTVSLDHARIPNGGGSYPISATFSADPGTNYAGSGTGSQPAAVQREGQDGAGDPDGSVVLDYTGDQFVLLGSVPNLVATISQADAERVDYAAAEVRVVFRVYPDGSASPIFTSAPIRVANRTDWAANGTGSAQVGGPAGLAADTYRISVEIVPNPYVLAVPSEVLLTVADPLGTFISGGGYLGRDAAANTGQPKGHFSFTVQSDRKNLKGKVTYRFQRRINTATSSATSLVPCTTLGGSCRDVEITFRSSKLNALSTGDTSTYPMSGFATGQFSVQVVDVVTGSHYGSLEWGGGTFRLDVTDASSGGATDAFGFSAYRKDGSLYHAAVAGPIAQTGTGAAANQAGLGGGNVAVHPK